MSTLRALASSAALLGAVLSAPAAAQPAAQGATPPFFLEGFVRDATAFAALPWQQEALGLSSEQTAALRGIAAHYQPTVEELLEELRMLFENVGMLHLPVDAHEAYALYYDIAMHKAEALMTFHEAAEAMRAVLTPAQRARWEAVLEEATCEQCGPVRAETAPSAPADTTAH